MILPTAFAILTLLSHLSPPVAASKICKCALTDACWPSESEFDALNATVSGNLINGIPPGSVCYQNSPWKNYDSAACDYVRTNWLNSTFHALNPISIGFPQWADNPCPPIYPNGTSVNGDPKAGEKGCSLGGYPVYALNATNSGDVQAVVRFVREHNIRLNVKSTGHSFTGRSTAYGSISIWTHYLQGIQYHESFQTHNCPDAVKQMAFSIAAGSRVRDVYEAADKHNAVVVGGSAQDVGIVGWLTGGGHGPLTSEYGMGADNVIQATVVTPKGDIVTANECNHSDLLWAIRGGGGGTFGVVTEVVMKGHPIVPMESLSFTIQPSDHNDLSAFWDAVAFWHSELPRLKQGGMSGYSAMYGPDFPIQLGENWLLHGSLSVFDKSNATTAALFEPIKRYMDDRVNYTHKVTRYPSFFTSWNEYIGPEPVGGLGIVLGSRLLTEESLTKDVKHLREAIRDLTETTQILNIYLVANSKDDANASLNPAWRDTVTHTITGTGFPDGASLEEQQAAYELNTNVLVPQLKALAPHGGAYFNEGDPFDPNWQYTYFGESYPKLQEVKKRYDPQDVMWCVSCVGSEGWVQEESGRLCRMDWVEDERFVKQYMEL